MDKKRELFSPGAGTIIGMVHCPPLPGTAGYDGNMERILERARQDAVTLEKAGVNAVIVENMGDTPFAAVLGTGQTCALTAAALEVRRAISIPVGIDAAFNDYRAALSVAAVVGAAFVRIPVFVDTVVFSGGVISPCARACMDFRRSLGAEHIRILADIQVKHAFMLVPGITPEQSARMAADCGADAILVTGTQTGEETPLALVQRVKRAVPLPVLVASGFTAQNAAMQLAWADGAVVGSGLKEGGNLSNPISFQRAWELMKKVRERSGDI